MRWVVALASLAGCTFTVDPLEPVDGGVPALD